MISYLSGEVLAKSKNSLTLLLASGIGYEVNIIRTALAGLKLGQKAAFYTHQRISENSQDLFGFATLVEKEFFELLISVNGLGPKGAMNILCLGGLEEIKAAIGRADVAYLTQVNGIGRKTAERIVVELKNKLVLGKESVGSPEVGGKLEEVISGLVGMGYSKDEAREVVKKLEVKNQSTEELLRQALRSAS